MIRNVHACLMLVFVIASFPSMAQLSLRGMVVDSATMHPLPDVNLVIKGGNHGTSTDMRGAFELKAGETDTVTISRVGFATKNLPAREINKVIIIFLKEQHQLLKTVEIQETVRIPWLPPVEVPSPWQNNSTHFTDAPGFRGVQTFGPGYIFGGVFTKAPKDSKERKELRQLQVENRHAMSYVSLVNDPEVKKRIMTEYNLTEQAYYDGLARFNEENRDIIYLEGPEVLGLLMIFFAREAGFPKK